MNDWLPVFFVNWFGCPCIALEVKCRSQQKSAYYPDAVLISSVLLIRSMMLLWMTNIPEIMMGHKIEVRGKISGQEISFEKT